MLKVQTYLKALLKNYSPAEALEKLTAKYAIKVTAHPTKDLVLLNYNQIESPKTSEITRESRGLCLDKNNFDLVSRGFRRFFNLGEWRADDNKFDWNDCIIQSKEDGTFLNVFYHQGDWMVCTRGSFGEISFYDGGPSPSDLFNGAIGDLLAEMDMSKTYIFELCSRHNKIVRDYPTPVLYLLSMFEGENELSSDYIKLECQALNGEYGTIRLPERFSFSSSLEVENYIRERSKLDKTFEGVVVRDKNNVRLKIKNPDYLCLHRLRGETNALFMPKNLIGFILDGEIDEILVYFDECKPTVEKMTKILNDEYKLLYAVWLTIKDITNRKDFAISIPSSLKSKSLLFKWFDSKIELSILWKTNKELLLKCLF